MITKRTQNACFKLDTETGFKKPNPSSANCIQILIKALEINKLFL